MHLVIPLVEPSQQVTLGVCALPQPTLKHLGPAAVPITAVKTGQIRLLAALVHHAPLLPRGARPLRAVLLARQGPLRVVVLSLLVIRLSCSSPTAWETLFHILFSIVPWPFCVVPCVFQSPLSLDRLGRAGRLLWDKPPGVARVR